MTFARPSLSSLIERTQADIEARLPGADSRLRRNVLDVLARTHAGALHGAYGLLDEVSRFLPDVAESERLARWASIFGLTRKAAQRSEGFVSATGVDGSVIPTGSIYARSDGARYLTRADVEVAGGLAAVPIEAETPGSRGAMLTGQALTLLSPITGVQAAASVSDPGLSGGVDEEGDDALRARLLQRLRAPVRGGAASDYSFWATEVAEVTRAWVYGNWNGLGTVKVLFVCDDRPTIIPAAGDVTAVGEYIEARRPVGAQVTVAAPVASPLNLTLQITPDSPGVRGAIEAELRDLIAREAEPGGTLLISHIREAVSLAAGEVDHSLTVPSANVTAAEGAIKTFGAITWVTP